MERTELIKGHIQRLLDRTHAHRLREPANVYLVGKEAGLMAALGFIVLAETDDLPTFENGGSWTDEIYNGYRNGSEDRDHRV